MGRRTEFGARWEGRRVALRRRRPATTSAVRVLVTVPVAAGIAVGVWRWAGTAVGPALRDGVVVLGAVMVVAGLRLVRGGKR